MSMLFLPEERGWNREITNTIVNTLIQKGARVTAHTENIGAFDYELVFFPKPEVQVTVSILIADWQTDSDIVITNMTILPEKERRKGYGCLVIGIISEWAKLHQFNEIRATQVNDTRSERFWRKNGFTYLPDPNPTGDFVLKLPHPLQ